MPTNPLWIEHTEKAAWDTVRALREQVEQERARSERLTQLEPALPRIAELLDQARAELSLGNRAPVTVIEELLARVRAFASERDELRRALERERERPVPVAPAPAPSEPRASEGGRLPPALRWFARELDRRMRERRESDEAPSGGSLAEVASRVEERLRGATPLPYAPRALLLAAIELGLDALELARAARRAERAG